MNKKHLKKLQKLKKKHFKGGESGFFGLTKEEVEVRQK